jgi:phage terminase small subunit
MSSVITAPRGRSDQFRYRGAVMGKGKAGTSKAAAAARRAAFMDAYMGNGHNATQAAIAAGYSARSAASQGQRLLKDVENSGDLAEAARKVAKSAGLTAEGVLEELWRIVGFDLRKLYREDGSLKNITELDDETRAGVASFEIDERGHVTKIKFWDRLRAIEMAMKHQGLFERDNQQRKDNIAIQINLVD